MPVDVFDSVMTALCNMSVQPLPLPPSASSNHLNSKVNCVQYTYTSLLQYLVMYWVFIQYVSLIITFSCFKTYNKNLSVLCGDAEWFNRNSFV